MMERLLNRETLSRTEAKELITRMLDGVISDEQIAAILTILRFRGETVEEIIGFAGGMKEHSMQVKPPFPVLDTCGTGGDGVGTFNISTAVAILLSSMGVPVAKHGNRSVSSKTGSADVLEYLGVPIQSTAEEAIHQLEENHLCFLYAPLYHSAMKQVATARKRLGVKTIFNLLGPLTNPAGASRRLIGVYDKDQARKMAQASLELGIERAMFVTGEDGLDEITITGPTFVSEVDQGQINEYVISPEDVGMTRGTIAPLLVKSPQDSGEFIQRLFTGKGPDEGTNILLLNAGAALYVFGKAKTIKDGVDQARQSLGNPVLLHLDRLRGAREAFAK
ncbi:anthranilate phosphoribosyltransferase [Evansella tamaricis]|uniref:anthranilate phosphoribosyltransferase n=1 Tax=Evansella tamaricis TaxID=2069301 RepID=UPI00362A86B0